MTARLPLANIADTWLRNLAPVDGETLLGERAMLAGLRIPGHARSAGGGCRMFQAQVGGLALNLARDADRALLPALFETDDIDPDDDVAIGRLVAGCDAARLLDRGRSMGLAIAAQHEPVRAACQVLAAGARAEPPAGRAPRVLDLSALWAGPLTAHLLWLGGAEVVKLEGRARPDAMRDGNAAFYALLNQGKASVVLDFDGSGFPRALASLVAGADIVIEAARPRALAQRGIDAAALVRARPGLVWVSITGHGAAGEAADWVGFGDDCGVAGGLLAALRAASGAAGFVGDAIADPLTGIFAACIAREAWRSGQGGRFGVSMSGVAAVALAQARAADAPGLDASLAAWRQAAGAPFPAVRRRPVSAAVPGWGADTRRILSVLAPC